MQKKQNVQASFVDGNFYYGIHPESSLADKWYSKKSSSMKCNLKNCKIMTSCLDFEEEMEEGVEDTQVFKRVTTLNNFLLTLFI